jgi:hypothetical protein
MHRSLIVAAALACLATACSQASNPALQKDSGGGGTDAPSSADAEAGCVPFDAPDANLTTPTVSFSKDILPTFQMTCGIAGATCHGSPAVVTVDQRPFLGFFDGGTDASVVVNGLVGVKSPEDPQLSIVKAGDPPSSYLMHKLDGDQCQFASACAQGLTQYTDCGQQMPYSSPPLDETTRDTVRRWIAQGAKSN